MSRSRHTSSTVEMEVEVAYSLSGRFVPATQLDPPEEPEVEIDAVEVVAHSRRGATRINILDALSQADVERIRDEILEE